MAQQKVLHHSFKKKDKAVTLGTSVVKVNNETMQIDPQPCFKGSSQQELGMTSWKRSSNSNFAAIPQQSSKPDMLWGLLTNLHLQMLWLLMPKDVVEPTGQSQYVLDGGSLVQRIPWQRGTTYNDIWRQYTNYVTRRYGHAIVAFAGYQEDLFTNDGAHERRKGGRAVPTVDFTRDMVMKYKNEDLLSNKDNKQRFIRMLGQSLEHVGCETHHGKSDADVLIVDTTVQSAMSCKTILVGDDTDLLVILCFHVNEDSCEVLFKPEIRSGTKKSPRCW